MTIGERIRARREALNITQKDMAERLGYTDHTTLAKIEANKVDIPLPRFIKIAEILGVTPGYLLGDDDQSIQNDTASSVELTNHEKALIEAYRQNPAMQTAVDKLLGIEASGAGGDVLQDMAAQLSITLPRSNSAIKQK